ncbi:SDR family NAD(P)-dependent oxidoreductase [Catellatospora sp. KI3]|uniref:SDR family NAD(P)-dependent oxidoreductase n=1 Tax=Catellatospora sp. KI3 TaxID=3041620 RepID=UPI0024826E4D|nr:SDR family NAD(P)-dependent oxidoreductase [Catellatospora sp. KI3]MDI1465387.1 SDR family NAD(P)-dependent oxidoreductase [Catellatospora sp. KI3]
MDFHGKRVLVTGGTSGIGAALVQQLAQRGAQVATCGRDAVRLAEATSRTGVTGWIADLADPAAGADLVARAADALGGLDVVVASAAVQHQQAFTQGWTAADDTAVLAELRTNLAGPIALAGAAGPHLRRSGGVFTALTSALAYSPKKGAPVYCASKAGLSVFLRALRYQWEDERAGVCVQEALMPLVATPMTAGRNDGAMSADAAAAQIAAGIARRVPVIAVGRARSFRIVRRVAPGVADSLLRNG